MAIFIDYQKKFIILNSYKVGYSTLCSKSRNGLKQIHYIMDWQVYKHLIRLYDFKTYFLVRHPYKRFFSLFYDKFRKQPQRILNNEHKWENVHFCLFSKLGIKKENSDEQIANRFFEMQPSELVSFLPDIYQCDAHFFSQKKTNTYYFLDNYSLPLRVNGYFRMEDQMEDFEKVTGLNMGIFNNESRSNEQSQSLSSQDKLILNSLYKDDFLLGNYKMDKRISNDSRT